MPKRRATWPRARRPCGRRCASRRNKRNSTRRAEIGCRRWRCGHECGSPTRSTLQPEPGLARCRTALERQSAPRAERFTSAPAPAPRSPAEAQYREALELYSAGEVARAVPLLREVQRLDPGNAAAAQLLAKADRQLRPLGAEDRARVRELYLHGMGYFTAGEFDKAIADWTKILALDPGNTSVYQNIQEARARRTELRQ